MKVMFNGRVLKNVRKVYKPIAAEIHELVEYLETTKVHPEEELKFNHRLFEYRWEKFREGFKDSDPFLYALIAGNPESLFREQHYNDEVNFLVILDNKFSIRVERKYFVGVKPAGTKFTRS